MYGFESILPWKMGFGVVFQWTVGGAIVDGAIVFGDRETRTLQDSDCETVRFANLFAHVASSACSISFSLA